VTAQAYSAQWWIGWALFAVGFCVFIEGIRWDGAPWWRALPKLKNPFRQRAALYAGRVIVDDSIVNTQHTINISAFVFNGTNERIDVVNAISGETQITLPTALGSVTIRPPTPTLVPPFRTGVGPGEEFTVQLRLHLSPADVQAYAHNVTGNTVAFSLDQVVIEVETTKRRKRVRVPLWDGANLSDGRVTNRIVNLGVSTTIAVHPGGV
jgi:hypothetical protein